MSLEANKLTSEQRFRQAFERIKSGKTKNIEKGSAVSQNNVAKEAGCDPSALRKGRFPSLIREIQAYVEIEAAQKSAERQQHKELRQSRLAVEEKLAEVTAQRDAAQSQLLSANRLIVEMALELKAARAALSELRPVGEVLSFSSAPYG